MRLKIAGLAIFMCGVAGVDAQSAPPASVTGVLTDTLCGARGANEKHTDHARNSVASGKAKYALYVETQVQTAQGTTMRGELYILEPTAQAAQLFAQYAGRRIRITGTVSATPMQRAGHSLAPDAVATTRNASGAQRPVSGNASRDSSGTVNTSPRVQQHRKALDTTTPVAGVLTITSVEAAPR